MKKNISVFDQYFELQIMERGIGYYYNDLVKVKDLLDKKIITQEEFEKEKKKILK